MDLVKETARRGGLERSSAGGLAGWVFGALQGRVRIKWRGHVRAMRQMQLVETLSLGGKRQVMLVVCNGERYLVGCGSDSVATIVKAATPEVDNRHAIKALAQAWL